MWKRMILICFFIVGIASLGLIFFQNYSPEIPLVKDYFSAIAIILGIMAGFNEAVELIKKIYGGGNDKKKEKYLNLTFNKRDDHSSHRNNIFSFVKTIIQNSKVDDIKPNIPPDEIKKILDAIIDSGNNPRIQFVDEELIKINIPDTDLEEFYNELEKLGFITNHNGIISVTSKGKKYLRNEEE